MGRCICIVARTWAVRVGVIGRRTRSRLWRRWTRLGLGLPANRNAQLAFSFVVQLETSLALRQGHLSVVRRCAGHHLERDALHCAPARRSHAEEGGLRVHRVFLRKVSRDWVSREVLHRERHTKSVCTHACRRDECGARGGALSRGCRFNRREPRYLQRVRRDRFAQIGPHA